MCPTKSKKNILLKKITFFILIFSIFFSLIYFFNSTYKKQITETSKITIVATLFPQYDFAKKIGQEKVEVHLLLPPGLEAHSFEPKPSDLVKINQADIFIYTGEFMEPWAHEIVKSLNNKKLKIVNASENTFLLKNEKIEHQYENHTSSNLELINKETHLFDPHIWLDFSNAQIMAENIANALLEMDPKNTEYYLNNLNNYLEQLNNLENNYKNILTNCETRTLIYGGHYAFGYLAKKYNLTYYATQGFSPDAEPSAKDLINLVGEIKENNIKYIFYEELTSPKIAETLAEETKTKLLLLNGAHNLAKDDYEKEATFISLMEENLENLSLGLNCKK